MARDHLVVCDVANGYQHHSYGIVRKHRVLTVSRIDALHPVPEFVVGEWPYVDSTGGTIR